MITIEGQDFYNYAEALFYLFSLVGDNYNKEEIDELIAAINTRIDALPIPLTIEQVREIIDEELGVIVNGRY